MFHQLIVLVCVLQSVLAAPQFVSFKDGKVGVNFGGYHAEAGLGGLLTGNAAHGGLSASAGTPWGPQAAAGLNGNLDGRAAGGAYAGAQFNPDVGASSVIGGSVGGAQHGFAGAEAHSSGNHVSKTYGVDAPIQPVVAEEPVYSAQPAEANSIQKIKPPKKYNLVKSEIVQNVEPNRQHDAGDDSSLTKTNSKTILSTVDSRRESVNSEHSDIFQPASPSLSSVAADKTTSFTGTLAGHVVAEDSAGIIIVNKNRHRERKQKLHHRRRLAQPRQRVHSLERVAPSYVESAAVPIEAALSAPATLSATSFVDVNTDVAPPTVVHSKQVLKTVYKEVRPPTGHTVVAQGIPEAGYETRHSDVHVNSGLVGNVLNIPIGILRSLQESLAGININKSTSHTKL